MSCPSCPFCPWTTWTCMPSRNSDIQHPFCPGRYVVPQLWDLWPIIWWSVCCVRTLTRICCEYSRPRMNPTQLKLSNLPFMEHIGYTSPKNAIAKEIQKFSKWCVFRQQPKISGKWLLEEAHALTHSRSSESFDSSSFCLCYNSWWLQLLKFQVVSKMTLRPILCIALCVCVCVCAYVCVSCLLSPIDPDSDVLIDMDETDTALCAADPRLFTKPTKKTTTMGDTCTLFRSWMKLFTCGICATV